MCISTFIITGEFRYVYGQLHSSVALTGWNSIWDTSEGTRSEMSSFVVKSKIFLRFEPVEDRQSLSNVCNRMFGRQAGLSRDTLEISSEFSSNFHLRTHKSHSAHHGDHLYKLGFLPLELIFILRICKIWFGPQSLSFEYDPISGCWDIPPLIFAKVKQTMPSRNNVCSAGRYKTSWAWAVPSSGRAGAS
jgi:hypothetical protein